MPSELVSESKERSLRVLLIDDHTLFRTGLQELLGRWGIRVVAATGDGREGCRLAEELAPDVILLDLRMPDIDGLGVLDGLKEAGVAAPVVMLTTSADQHDLVECLRRGARGYLLKDMEPDDLVASLWRTIDGKTVVGPDMADALARVVQGDQTASSGTTRFDELTPRETEILEHLADGQSNKMIARDLGITDGTVKLHVRSILRKLHVHSRVEAAILAVEEGMRRGK